MIYTYICEKYNSHMNIEPKPIIDESLLISSPAYLHTFTDLNSKKYNIIAASLGVQLPYISVENLMIIGTTRCVYYINIASNIVLKTVLLPSACNSIVNKGNIIIVICETDVLIISKDENNKVFKLNDVVIDSEIFDNYLIVNLMEGKHKKIAF